MDSEEDLNVKECKESRKMKYYNYNISVYGLAFIGAFIYYIQQATTFWIGVLGFFKALVWPAMLVYKLLEFLNM